MSDEVTIHHPGRNKTLTVPATLWPGRLAAKGWQEADAPAEITAVRDPVDRDAEGLNAALDRKAELRDRLDAAGVQWDGRWGEKRLQAEVDQLGETE